MEYKVTFSGFYIVEADDEEEAKEKAENDDYMMMETEIDAVELL